MIRRRAELTDEQRYDAVMKLRPTHGYSIADAAMYIGCSVRQIYLMMNDNRLPFEPATPKHPHRTIKGFRIKEYYLNN